MINETPVYLSQLHDLLDQSFDLEGIHHLCFQLHADHESMSRHAKLALIRNLLLRLGQQGRLPEIVVLVRRERPNLDWPSVPNNFTLSESLAVDGMNVPTNQYNYYGSVVQGDSIQGDKFSGDKVYGNKTRIETYIKQQVIVQGLEITDIEKLPPADGDPPYKGLTHFNEEDWEWFFGRETITSTLVNRLHDLNFLAVVGASGSGKSSLVRAGVVPVMTGTKTLPDGTEPLLGNWKVYTLTPTARPLTKLAVTLFPNDHTQQTDIQEQAQQDAHTLHNAISTQTKSGHKLLLVIDQFEELFTLCNKESERQAFITNLLTLAKENSAIKVIITLRADFYANCLRYDELRYILKNGQEPLGAMTGQELVTAVLEPAAKGDWKFQAGLVEQMLDDLGQEPGSLPLLSHALLETWKRRRGRTLTLSGYQEAGKVKGAIAKTAGETFDKLDSKEKVVAKRLFLRLTELGEGTQDTRRRVSQKELGDDKLIQTVTKKMADARLVTTSQDDVDVAHEALIREWPRLREWLNTNREGLIIHRRLTVTAQTWEEKEKDSSYLYTGLRLGEAEEWTIDNSASMNNLEQMFLNASIQTEKQRQRNRRLIQIVGIAALVIVIMSIIGSLLIGEERNEAVAQTTRAAESEMTAVAAQSTSSANAGLANAESTRAIEAQQTAVVAQSTAESAAIAEGMARSTAEAAQQEAETARQETNALSFAVASQNQLDTNHELALLLAIESANEMMSISNEDTLPLQINTALRQALLHSGRSTNLLVEHTEKIKEVLLSPDNKYFLTYGRQEIRVWDALTLQLVNTLNTTTDIQHIAWSPDSQYFAVAMKGEGETVSIWKALASVPAFNLDVGNMTNHLAWNSTSTRLATASGSKQVDVWMINGLEATLEMSGTHDSPVDSVVWNENDSQLLTISGRKAHVWDIDFANNLIEKQITFNNDGRLVTTALWHPDGIHVLTVDNNVSGQNYVYGWNIATGQKEKRFLHDSAIHSIQLSRDGKQLITAAEDGLIKLWDWETGEQERVFAGHNDAVNAIVWNEDETEILSSSQDTTSIIWDMETGGIVVQLTGHENSVTQAVWNNNESQVISISDDMTIRTWNSFSGTEIATLSGHTEGINRVAWSHDGNRIVTASEDATAIVWDAVNGQLLYTLEPHNGPVKQATWSPDDNYILTVGNEGNIRLWDAGHGELLQEIDGHDIFVNQADWYAGEDEFLFVTASEDQTAKIWSFVPSNEAELSQVLNALGPVRQAIWSYDGMHIATIAFYLDGHSIQIWDVKTGQPSQLAQEASGTIEYIDWNYDSTKLAVARDDFTTTVIDTANSGLETSLGEHTGVVYQAVWQPNGDLLATVSDDRRVIIWNVETTLPEHILTGHQNRVNQVDWRLDGEYIATASNDYTAKVWSVDNGQQVASLEGHTNFVSQVVWDPTGNRVVTASDDGTARIYYVTSDALLALACQRSVRQMTEIEWKAFMEDQPYRQTCSATE